MDTREKPLIALLAAEETSPSVLYGLYDVLYSVGAVYPDMTMGEPGPEALDVRIVAAQAEPFRCIGHVMVEPHAAIDEIDAADVVVVCDMYTPINEPPRDRYPREGCTPPVRWSVRSAPARWCWPRPDCWRAGRWPPIGLTAICSSVAMGPCA